jgi:hypothetical protein
VFLDPGRDDEPTAGALVRHAGSMVRRAGRASSGFVRVDDERVIPNRWQQVRRQAPNAPSGLSRAEHIWRGLMNPNKPRDGMAAQPVVTVGAVGMLGVVHTAGLPA